MARATLIVFMIIATVLLFSAMVLSAMASGEANKGCSDCKEGCHKYSMWSALVTGLAVGAIVISLIVYIYSSSYKGKKGKSMEMQSLASL